MLSEQCEKEPACYFLQWHKEQLLTPHWNHGSPRNGKGTESLMAGQTTVLQLVLNELQLSNSISTIDDRIVLQKIVCLTQEAGLSLGYSFNWYVRGPYSPSLASDYYMLASSREEVEGDAKQFVLTESALVSVSKVAQLLSVPVGIPLTRVHWLELLASIAFLMRRHRLNEDATQQKLNVSKPTLAPHFGAALTALRQAGFTLE